MTSYLCAPISSHIHRLSAIGGALRKRAEVRLSPRLGRERLLREPLHHAAAVSDGHGIPRRRRRDLLPQGGGRQGHQGAPGQGQRSAVLQPSGGRQWRRPITACRAARKRGGEVAGQLLGLGS